MMSQGRQIVRAHILLTTLVASGLVLVGLWLGPQVWQVAAAEQRPPCADWDQWWFHHRITPEHIRYCLTHKHVEINQKDQEDGRTLLHRIARDFHEQHDDLSYDINVENRASFLTGRAVPFEHVRGGEGEMLHSLVPGSDLRGARPPTEEERQEQLEQEQERQREWEEQRRLEREREQARRRRPGATRPERLAMVRELLTWNTLDLEVLDKSGRTAVQLALRKTQNWQVANLLIQAGARLTFSEDKAKELEENVLPMAQTLAPRVRNPFKGEMDVDALLACQTANCVMTHALK